MKNLPLQIREVDYVEINQSDCTDTRGGKIQRDRRAKPACSDQQYAGAFERTLSIFSYLRQENVTAVAHQLLAGQLSGVALRFGAHVGDILRLESVSPSLGR